MKQEQTIDDILKMLKDSVNSEQPSSATTEMFETSPASVSEEDLKEISGCKDTLIFQVDTYINKQLIAIYGHNIYIFFR